MINYQIISSRGKPRFAVVDYQSFMKLLEEFENQKDASPANVRSRKRKEPSARELTRLMRSNPIKGWRLFRNMTQAELAEKTGLKQTHVSLMEARKIKPRRNTLHKLASALACDVDDLITRHP